MERIDKVLLATGNAGKIKELKRLFASMPFRFLDLSEFPGLKEVEETGSTFAENARLKAEGYARQTGTYALADDSGLEIDALDGRPGVLSARYGGETTGFSQKMLMLLKEMDGSPRKERTARFACTMALSRPDGTILFSAEGECRGGIALEPRGSGGFGYDPLFIPDGHDRTFGELSDDAKEKISHRAMAADKIIRYLLDFTGLST